MTEGCDAGGNMKDESDERAQRGAMVGGGSCGFLRERGAPSEPGEGPREGVGGRASRLWRALASRDWANKPAAA